MADTFRFFLDLYRRGLMPKKLLFLLLSRKDAENIVIGAAVGKSAAEKIGRA